MKNLINTALLTLSLGLFSCAGTNYLTGPIEVDPGKGYITEIRRALRFGNKEALVDTLWEETRPIRFDVNGNPIKEPWAHVVGSTELPQKDTYSGILNETGWLYNCTGDSIIGVKYTDVLLKGGTNINERRRKYSETHCAD